MLREVLVKCGKTGNGMSNVMEKKNVKNEKECNYNK